MKVLFGVLLVACLATSAKAQDTLGLEQTSAGIGFGMDYGGIGFNIHHFFMPELGVFGGIGYALAGVGYNVGIKGRFFTGDRIYGVFPFVEAMYGYNAAIAVENGSQYNKIFYGPTFGLGLDIRPKAKSRGCWSIGLLLPIRSDDVEAYMDDLEQNHGVVFKNDLPPVGFSFGYRWMISAFPRIIKP